MALAYSTCTCVNFKSRLLKFAISLQLQLTSFFSSYFTAVLNSCPIVIVFQSLLKYERSFRNRLKWVDWFFVNRKSHRRWNAWRSNFTNSRQLTHSVYHSSVTQALLEEVELSSISNRNRTFEWFEPNQAPISSIALRFRTIFLIVSLIPKLVVIQFITSRIKRLVPTCKCLLQLPGTTIYDDNDKDDKCTCEDGGHHSSS